MPPKLTFDQSTGKYSVPQEWLNWDWINDPSNYPDKEHTTFLEEYDWDYRYSGKGVLNRYINTIEGREVKYSSKTGKKCVRNIAAKPYIYYMFSLAAVELIQKPELYREARQGRLNGAFVVNYANSINVRSLSFLPTDVDSKRYLISTEFTALLARVFNEHSGILEVDKLLLEQRDPRKSLCPHCQAIFEVLSGNYILPTDDEYEQHKDKFFKRLDYKVSRDTNG